MSDNYCLERARKLIKQGEGYLKKHGYGDYDVYELSQATPTENPPGANRNVLMDFYDNRPNAEIVATAHMIYLAKAVLEAHKTGEKQLFAELLYYLGHTEAVAQLFVVNPGVSSDMATGYNEYLHLGSWSKRYAEDRVKNLIKMDCLRKKKSDQLSTRNKWICSEAGKLMGTGRGNQKKPFEITSILVNRYSRKFPEDGPLSKKQVRRILRDAGMIPPATSRK